MSMHMKASYQRKTIALALPPRRFLEAEPLYTYLCLPVCLSACVPVFLSACLSVPKFPIGLECLFGFRDY